MFERQLKTMQSVLDILIGTAGRRRLKKVEIIDLSHFGKK
jgi:hypothetical protein